MFDNYSSIRCLTVLNDILVVEGIKKRVLNTLSLLSPIIQGSDIWFTMRVKEFEGRLGYCSFHAIQRVTTPNLPREPLLRGEILYRRDCRLQIGNRQV